MKEKRNENGSVVMEATLSLSVFMFLIVTILSIVNICVAQAKIGIALNQSAEELSQYLYIYSLSGLNQVQADAYANNSQTIEQIEGLEEGLTDSIQVIKDFGSNGTLSSGDIDAIKDGLSSIQDNVQKMDEIAEEIYNTEDKSAWIKSLAKVAGNEGFEMVKGWVGGAIAKGLMAKHLALSDEIGCDTTLKRLGVVDGFSGLHMQNSGIYVNGTEDIVLVCNYKIRLLTLLKHDITFDFVQCAKTKAWGARSLVDERLHEREENAVDGTEVLLGGDDDENAKFVEYASKAQPVDGYIDVIVHCNGGKPEVYANGAWVELNSKNMKRILEGRGLSGKDIRLISCGTGSNNVAQSIADTMHVNVLAPTKKVWAYPDGYLTVGDTATDNSGEWVVVSPYQNK